MSTLAPVAPVAPEPLWFRVTVRKKGRGYRTAENLLSVPDRSDLPAALAELRAEVIEVRPAAIHACSACGFRGPWTSGWGWYGSYRDVEDGKPVVKTCSAPCFAQAKALKLIPASATQDAIDEDPA